MSLLQSRFNKKIIILIYVLIYFLVYEYDKDYAICIVVIRKLTFWECLTSIIDGYDLLHKIDKSDKSIFSQEAETNKTTKDI